MSDPYTVLGVGRSASQDEIRRAYRKLAKDTHPDLNPGNAEAERRFKEISGANDILSDPDRRRRFDAGEIDESGAEKPPQPQKRYYRDYAEADPNMRYAQRPPFDGGMGYDNDDLLNELFRSRRGGASRSPGDDVRYRLPVTLLEAFNGGKKSVVMPDGKTLEIAIPAGILDGQTLRLKGEGLPGDGGLPAGDAFVEIEIMPDPDLVLDGDDVRSILPISLGEALNGASVRAQTLDGAVDVKIPKRAKDRMTLRLRNKGMRRGKGKDRGDQLITIEIVPPVGGDDELADFIAKWEAKHPQNPRARERQRS